MFTKPFGSNSPIQNKGNSNAFRFVANYVKRLVVTTKVASFGGAFAPQNYYNVRNRTSESETITNAGVTLEGGVILNTWGPLSTNVYASSSFASVGDRSTKLSGVVQGTVSERSECSGIAVRILDGNAGNTYELTAYDGRGNVVGSVQAVAEPGCHADLAIAARPICSFRIAPKDQNRSNFAFESVSISFAPKWIGRVKASCSSILKARTPSSVISTGHITETS